MNKWWIFILSTGLICVYIRRVLTLLGKIFYLVLFKLNRNNSPDRYSISAYGIGVDVRERFSVSDGSGLVKP